MLERLLVAVEIVDPPFLDRLVDYAERLALENPEECELEPWITTLARLWGLAFLLFALRGGASLATLRSVLGLNGLLAVPSPDGFLDYWTGIVYEDHEPCEWKPWVVPATP